MQVLAARFTTGDEPKFLKDIQRHQLVAAVKARDLAGVRGLVEVGGLNVSQITSRMSSWMSNIASLQIGPNVMTLAAQQDDWSMFEYLAEQGAMIPPEDEMNEAVASMLQRRQNWVVQAAWLAHERHLPLTAVRVIHEYMIGFNWSAVCGGISQCVSRVVDVFIADHHMNNCV